MRTTEAKPADQSPTHTDMMTAQLRTHIRSCPSSTCGFPPADPAPMVNTSTSLISQRSRSTDGSLPYAENPRRSSSF